MLFCHLVFLCAPRNVTLCFSQDQSRVTSGELPRSLLRPVFEDAMLAFLPMAGTFHKFYDLTKTSTAVTPNVHLQTEGVWCYTHLSVVKRLPNLSPYGSNSDRK